MKASIVKITNKKWIVVDEENNEICRIIKTGKSTSNHQKNVAKFICDSINSYVSRCDDSEIPNFSELTENLEEPVND